MENPSRLLSLFVLNGLFQVTVIVVVAALASRLLNHGRARLQNLLWRAALVICVLVPLFTALEHMGVSPAAASPIPSHTPLWKTRTFAATVSAGVQWALAGIFLFALTCRLTRFLLRIFRTAGVLRAADPTLPGRIEILLTAAGAEAPHAVAIRFSSNIHGPATVGLLRPVILLPHWFRSARRDLLLAALAHELAHIRRADFAWLLFEEAMLALLAFHPLVLFLGKQLHRTRELACDELAAEASLDRRRYARCLIAIASSSSRTAAMLAFTGDDFGAMRERVARLASPAASHRTLASAAAGCLVLSAILIAGSRGIVLERPAADPPLSIAPPAETPSAAPAPPPATRQAARVRSAKKSKRGEAPPPPPPPPPPPRDAASRGL